MCCKIVAGLLHYQVVVNLNQKTLITISSGPLNSGGPFFMFLHDVVEKNTINPRIMIDIILFIYHLVQLLPETTSVLTIALSLLSTS